MNSRPITRSLLLLLTSLSTALGASAQAELTRQVKLASDIPAGNYSGLTPIGDDLYAVVDDKSATDGFHQLRIAIDDATGRIALTAYEGFTSSGLANRDGEGIAFVPATASLWMSGEKDNEVMEYHLDGQPTGRRLSMPSFMHGASHRYGLESLSYSQATRELVTTTESTLKADGQQASPASPVANKLRLMCFSEQSLELTRWYYYTMDRPQARRDAPTYAFGVSEMLALDDGRWLVMERELAVPKRKIGARVWVKIYVVDPRHATTGTTLGKQLVASWKSKLNLTARSWANYEGMCLGPRLADGRQTVILIADSQGQYRGVLRDYIRTLILPEAAP